MPVSDHDIERLRRAIKLARKAFYTVEPNPPVGCVIEDAGGGVVGESWTAPFGGPHAEVRALSMAPDQARGATAYVSLAPCGRHGKTPPCAGALLAAGIRRVVYAVGDPSPVERGAGLEQLRRAGIEVVGPVPAVASEAEALLGRFRASLARRTPWTILKWAMSLDGYIAPSVGAGGPISGHRAHLVAHQWRGYADAVAVGVGTVLSDDPLLTCRLEKGVPDGRPQPRRVVFDTHLRTPVAGRLAQDARVSPVLLISSKRAQARRRTSLEAAGCVIGCVALDGRGRLDLRAALEWLYERGVRRLLVEGGASIHGALLRAGLADQVSAFVAPMLLGGATAVSAVTGSGIKTLAEAERLEEVMWRRVGDDLLMQGYLPV